MMNRTTIIIIVLSITFASCKNQAEKHTDQDQVAELFNLMQGSFTSELQSQSDSTYFNISLHMYPIWKDKGHFLYVEQALFSMQDRPYRQRIYELVKLNDSIIASKVYTIPNDSLLVGQWKTPERFNDLSFDTLISRNGCEVLLKRIGNNHYAGATNEKACESSLRGASYATSEVEIWADKIISWDRGFDQQGNHVWGAEKGGYIFDKQH